MKYKNYRPDTTNVPKPRDVILVDENQNEIEALEISFGEVLRLIGKNISQEELRKTFCLQFIDPWGDTTFNRVQIEVLRNEFEHLLGNCQTNEEKEKLKLVIEFIAKAEKLNIFVKFYGD